MKERKEAASEGRKAVTSEDLILRMTVARYASSILELDGSFDTDGCTGYWHSPCMSWR